MTLGWTVRVLQELKIDFSIFELDFLGDASLDCAKTAKVINRNDDPFLNPHDVHLFICTKSMKEGKFHCYISVKSTIDIFY